jgi:phosphoglycolate phosphatase
LGNQGFLIMIKHFIFDLDGTLLDTAPDLARAIQDTLIAFGLPSVTLQETKTFIGGGARQFVQAALKGKGNDLTFFETFFAAYMIRYEAYQLESASIYPGISRLLKTIQQRGYHAYIFSNKPHELTVKLIDQVFPSLFKGVHGHVQGTLPKPDRTMFDHFAVRHGISLPESVFIGDAPPDVLMGQILGIPTIAVTYGYTDRAVLASYHPTKIVSRADEILDAVKSIK